MTAEATAEALRVTLTPHHSRIHLTGAPNTLSPAMLSALHAALDEAEGSGRRAVVLSAEGPEFCLGMPLDPDRPDAWEDSAHRCWKVFQRLARSPLATVALVEGHAVGGGVALAAACDIVLAGPAATFRLTELMLGLIPAMALPFIARRTGMQPAYQLAVTARELDAASAQSIHLADVAGSCPDEMLRTALIGIRRTEPGALTALKRFRDEISPIPEEVGPAAVQALRSRLAMPVVRSRLRALREGGML